MSSNLFRALMLGVVLVVTGPAIAAGPTQATSAEMAAGSPASPKALPAEGVRSGNPVRDIPLAELAVTRDRPIFSPSRRPPPPPVAAPIYTVASAPRPAKVEVERPPLTLVGTVVSENEAIAIFLDRTTREVVRLRTLESREGWVLRSVHGREVTLQKEREPTAVLALAPPGGSADMETAQATVQPTRSRSRE
jgi:hypothetical protein